MGERAPGSAGAGGSGNGAWSSAYHTLQAAHIKLQGKYDSLKELKLQGLMDEAEAHRAELAEHGAKVGQCRLNR